MQEFMLQVYSEGTVRYACIQATDSIQSEACWATTEDVTTYESR
jgi:hypothetical protein